MVEGNPLIFSLASDIEGDGAIIAIDASRNHVVAPKVLKIGQLCCKMSRTFFTPQTHCLLEISISLCLCTLGVVSLSGYRLPFASFAINGD